MRTSERIARNLAAGLLAGVWTRAALLRRTAAVLGRRTRKSQQALIDELLERAPAAYPPAPDWLAAFFLRSPYFKRAAGPRIKNPKSLTAVLKPAKFAPAERFAELAVPRLAAPGDIAAWLDLSLDQLDWFADSKRQQGRTTTPLLQNYRYAFAAKKSGPPRLIEIPKPRLKAVQRRILREILDKVPPHERAHGFVRGRSCLSGAQVHAGENIVVTVDLQNFFLNTRLSRVHALFRSLGYPWAVARLLTGLCSSATPASVFLRLPPPRRHDWPTQKTYQNPHLPQGAPTSPALANLTAWRLDARLLGLANTRGANYTRYADDLAFSGDDALGEKIKAFLATVEEIVSDEGFALHGRKTRIMRRGARQRVTGLVVNEHLNVSRTAYDTLKATLHNCIENGPDIENRSGLRDFRAHLDGRITWAENVNPARAQRLRQMFEEIRW
jgi:RNA-directed DNA polymerase